MSERMCAIRRAATGVWWLTGFAFVVLTLTFSVNPSMAFAENALSTWESPCVPTDEQLAQYAADGSLDARAQAVEQLGHDQPSSALVQQALARQAAIGSESSVALQAVPSDWASGMGSVGSVHVLVLRVSFPDYDFDESDTLAKLEAQVNGGPDAVDQFPCESLRAYYQRASYGKLDITGKAFDYRATHERSYYEQHLHELYDEALTALDGTVDFSQFDGNGDGLIDAVYLHFAGPNTGWGSTWWSQEMTYPTYAPADLATKTYDGKRLWGVCLLSGSAASVNSTRTLIHETGHVLGLPDLYNYNAQTSGDGARSGSLSFDLMDNNTGDTNALFKWMLGWIDEDKVVRIVANADGITVQRAGAREHFEASSIDQVLSAYTEDDPAACGGFIAVSNSDDLLDSAKGLFSSFYLLQYDHHAGNQSISYKQNVQLYALPSGFRLYRVQAELDADGRDFVHTNSRGAVFDQLIELVDPDMDQVHSVETGCAPAVFSGSGYGCMLYTGSTVSPTTYPSTNFNESIVSGFTGLTFSVTASNDDSGAVTIAWSDAERPDPADFSLSLASNSLGNIDSVRFAMSVGGLFRPDAHQAWPYLLIDGRQVFGASTADRATVSIAYQFNPATMTPTSSCEAVFPAGCFVIGYDGDNEVLSPEIRVPFLLSDLAAFDESGVYGESASSPYRLVGMTSVLTRGDGSHCYLRADGQDLYLDTIDDHDPTSVTSRRIQGAELAGVALSSPVMNAVMLPGDRCFLTMTRDDAQPDEAGHTYLVDLAAGTVVEGASATELSGVCSLLGVGRTPVLSTYAYRYGLSDGCVLSSALPEGCDWGGEQGAVTGLHRLWTAASTVCDAGGGLVAAVFRETDPNAAGSTQQVVRLYRAAEVEALFAQAPSSLDPAVLEDFTAGLTAVETYELEGYASVSDVKAAGGDVYVLAAGHIDQGDPQQAFREGLLAKFDASGALVASKPLSPMSSLEGVFLQLSIGEHGAVAVGRADSGNASPFERRETLLFDSSLEFKGFYNAFANSMGGWVGGRWVATSWNCETAAAGGPGQEGDGVRRVHYAITGVLDAANQPDEPVTPDEPDVPPAPDTPDVPPAPDASDDEGGKSAAFAGTLTETGDTLPIAIVVACLAGAGVVALVAYRRAKQ